MAAKKTFRIFGNVQKFGKSFLAVATIQMALLFIGRECRLDRLGDQPA